MIHDRNFPFDNTEEREIVHVSPRSPNHKKTLIKIVLLSLLFAGLMFGAKQMYNMGRGTPDLSSAPLMIAKEEQYKFKPKERGGMKIAHMDKEIYENLNPAFIDNEEVRPLPEAERPIVIDEMANFIEEQVGEKFSERFKKKDGDSETTNKFLSLYDDEKWEEPKPAEIKNNILTVPPLPAPKPKLYKLPGSGSGSNSFGKGGGYLDGKKLAAIASEPSRSSGSSKKIDVTKILEKKRESEIWIQLGTFTNSDEATKAWQVMTETNGNLLGNNKIKITKSDLGEKGVSYRLQSGPLSSESAARDICKALNEQEQSCFFVKQNPIN